jgi:carboxylesterase
LFCHSLRLAFGKPCEIREHRWTGENTHQARLNAGAELAAAIENHCAGRTVHIVGHSHGGNVALIAANHLPAGRIQTIVLLANPNMRVSQEQALAPRWLYWGSAAERVRSVWNLYSPEDRIQATGGRVFHGLPSTPRPSVAVEQRYPGADHHRIHNGAIRWDRPLAAHRAMHSSAVGTVVGKLLGGETFASAMAAAGLDPGRANAVRDRGGFAGVKAAQEIICEFADPSPFDLGGPGSKVGVLFVHGFTASPAEMRPIANFVHHHTGWRCKAIVLPGHGTRVEELQTTHGRDWLDAVDKACVDLSESCQHVFLAGMSMGAVLCCHIAWRRAGWANLKGLILLSPAFGVSTRRAMALPLLRRVKRMRNKGPKAAHYFLDRGLFSYLEDPLNRVVDVLRLGRQAWSNLDKLKDVPVLLLSGDLDRTVSLDWMRTAIERNPWIRWVRLPGSRHILTVEPDSPAVFETSVRFMKECLGETK